MLPFFKLTDSYLDENGNAISPTARISAPTTATATGQRFNGVKLVKFGVRPKTTYIGKKVKPKNRLMIKHSNTGKAKDR